MIVKNKLLKMITIFVTLIFFIFVWLRGSLDKLFLDSDIARDLSEISKLWIGQNVIWLGPRFSVGLHSSPFYYYLFYIPIFLSRGSAYSIIIFNVFLAASALFLLGFLSVRKFGHKGVLVALVVGLLPWFQEIAIHPGNGFTYAIFLLAFLTSLWFKLPFVFSSFLLGISLSMHPGAIFGLPILIYELVKNKASCKKWLFSSLAFLLPFLPLIAFEFVTKGYWSKQWLAQPSLGFDLNFSFANIDRFFTHSGVSPYLLLPIFALLVYTVKGRERVWTIISFLGLFGFSFISEVPRHYLFGLIVLIWFSVVSFAIQKRVGVIILGIIAICLGLNTLFFQKAPPVSERPISKIHGVVEFLADSGMIEKEDILAVVSMKSSDTKTPQADDYRFFLRVKGYKVEEVSDYGEADKLIIFVEQPGLDWKNWNSWETDAFGGKSEPDVITYDDFTVAVYSK